MPDTYTLTRGSSPLLISMPHVGTEIPPEFHAHLTPRALETEDADWHLHDLYDFAPALGASVLRSRIARYVIDLNRPPDDTPMYPGASNTELCPTRFFTGEPLYVPECLPAKEEVERRKRRYWQPYHDALAAELERIHALHGFALLWDAHSIRGEIPWLFEGRLPDLNIGTADGKSCDPRIADAVMKACGAQSEFSSVLNGRFKGGYITRRYGRPADRIHAVQLEMVQDTYMQETRPYAYDAAKAARIQPLLKEMARAALQASISCYEK